MKRLPGVSLVYNWVLSLQRWQKRLILIILDGGLVPLSIFLALALVATDAHPTPAFATNALLLASALFGALMSHALGLPQVKLNAFEQNAIFRTAIFASLVTGFALCVRAALSLNTPSVPELLVAGMILLILAVMVRFIALKLLLLIYMTGQNRTRMLIYGAGRTGVHLALALRGDYEIEPVAYVDDNPTLQRMLVAGLRVHSPAELEKVISRMEIDQLVIATGSLPRARQTRVIQKAQQLGCSVRVIPGFAGLLGDGDIRNRMQPIDPGAFLNRPDHTFDSQTITDSYRGRNVLVTGAGGSIGSELSRQLVAAKPARLVLLENTEAALYHIERELRDLTTLNAPGETEIIAALGSVTNKKFVENLMIDNKIEDVFHAAAYKHVPLVEMNALSGLRNNVLGTKTMVDAARESKASRFVLISTDKAVRPSNVMGASKRMAELVVQDAASRSDHTEFSIVRFGNVLGSSGSVIPLFEEQIARGGPVTLTHDDVTRYFMTVTEASHLVLLAAAFAEGGEVFVLDMGKPVPIRDLARQMIENTGFTVRDEANPNGDIEIKVTGLRPGEKLHEELLIGANVSGTGHEKILRAREAHLSQIELASALRDMTRAIDDMNEDTARAVLMRWIEGFGRAPVVLPIHTIDAEETL